MLIELQITCAEKELKRRQKSYPRLVEQRQMMPQIAQQEIAAMAAIVRTLKNYKKMTLWMEAISKVPAAAEFSKTIDNQ